MVNKHYLLIHLTQRDGEHQTVILFGIARLTFMIFRHNIIEYCNESLDADMDTSFVAMDQILCNV